MAQSITPIAFRVGFYRVWDSLYSSNNYIKNYNFFFKSQIISLYIDGFFKKWTWNRKRSFFLNFLLSHVELSWSHEYIHMYVYVYNTGFEYVIYKLHKNLNKRFFLKKQKNDTKLIKTEHLKSFNLFFFRQSKKNNLYKNLLFLVRMKKLSDHFFVSEKFFNKVYLKSKTEKLFFENLDFKLMRNRSFKKIKKFYKKGFQIPKHKLTVYDLLFFFKNKKNKHVKTCYFLNLEKRMMRLIYNLFLFFKFLIRIRFFKTFLNFVNYFFLIKPFESSLKRYFLKDLFILLNLNKVADFQNKIKISLKRLTSESLTASSIGKHLWLKLVKKYKFGSVINGILRNIKKIRLFKGILIRANGRFTKKQRAWHSIFRYGKIPLSQQSALIDDFIVNVKLRYGTCSVRIYINYNV